MKENERVIAFRPEDYRLDEHGSVKPITGLMYERILVDDPDTGMTVAMIRYPKGFTVPLHSHHCAHGYYVLKGTLRTSEGDYGPGSFVWFKEGAPMVHGAGDEEVEAFRESEAGAFDAILMDMRIPVMDGLTAAREICKLDRPDAATIPIIALTANAFEEDVKQCLQAGMNAHLSKPVDMELLKQTLARLLAEIKGG